MCEAGFCRHIATLCGRELERNTLAKRLLLDTLQTKGSTYNKGASLKLRSSRMSVHWCNGVCSTKGDNESQSGVGKAGFTRKTASPHESRLHPNPNPKTGKGIGLAYRVVSFSTLIDVLSLLLNISLG